MIAREVTVGLDAQLEKFGHFLTDKGLRLTTQRQVIAEVFFFRTEAYFAVGAAR
jgi:Fe2+ or Zn2+ uptake regulation protein